MVSGGKIIFAHATESSITVRVWNARLEPGRNGRINSNVVFASLAPATSRMLQLAQQLAEGINLTFVAELLPFGVFDQFQNILHLIERLF